MTRIVVPRVGRELGVPMSMGQYNQGVLRTHMRVVPCTCTHTKAPSVQLYPNVIVTYMTSIGQLYLVTVLDCGLAEATRRLGSRKGDAALDARCPNMGKARHRVQFWSLVCT